jgi:diketogulonate reductase-like aldo/keto reductase
MHFPIGTANGKPEYDILETWKEMEKLVSKDNEPEKGKTRFIGISNFNVTQLKDLVAAASIKPKVHQIELHPYLQQNDFVDLHEKLGVGLTAYAPLGDTNPAYRAGGIAGGRFMREGHPAPLLTNPVLTQIAQRRGCTTAQVSLKVSANIIESSACETNEYFFSGT